MVAATLNLMAEVSQRYPQVRKDEVAPGDWIIIRTVKSEYRLRVLDKDLYEVSGGWFDKKGYASVKIGVAGATWGGSAILPQVLAACGLRVEFRNRLITSPVESIVILPARTGN
jgi:hypothetical protein